MDEEAIAMWAGLIAERAAGPVLVPTRGEPVSATVTDGQLRVSLGATNFTLRNVFSPAAWGEHRVRVGAELLVDGAARSTLLTVAQHQLEVSAASKVPGAERPQLLDAHLTRVNGGLLCDLLLFTIGVRGRFWMRIYFTDDGPGRLSFDGPRGKKSRIAALDCLAGFL